MPIQRLSNAGQSGYRYKSLIAGITPVASVPTIGTATALTYATASVTFTAPGAYGATTFTATSSPGGITGTSATSPITVSGLSQQTAYTFTVTATNASGTSSPSAASNSITTPTAFAPEGAYDSLATVTLAASTTTVTFAGIPSGYKHLQMRFTAINASAAQSVIMRYNADSSSSYAKHAFVGYRTGTQAAGYTGSYFNLQGYVAGSTTPYPVVGVVDVLDYASTSKNKTTRILSGWDGNSSGEVGIVSGLYASTNSITSMTISLESGGSFAANSSFALYGVK